MEVQLIFIKIAMWMVDEIPHITHDYMSPVNGLGLGKAYHGGVECSVATLSLGWAIAQSRFFFTYIFLLKKIPYIK